MKVTYDVVLVSIEDVEKTISLLKYMLNINEDKAEEICNNLPYPIFEGISKADTISIENTLTGCGAKVEINEIVEETLYKIILNRCEHDVKINMIKAVRDIMHVDDLKEAKRIVEDAPITLVQSVTLDYAKNIEDQFRNRNVSSYITIEEM